MKKIVVLFCLSILSTSVVFAQNNDYLQSIMRFRESREKEFKTPETSPFASYKELKNFKGFKWYEVNQNYKVVANITLTPNESYYDNPTFGNKEPERMRKYGVVRFVLNGREFSLNVYQIERIAKSSGGKNYLFLPFTDLTNQNETYSGGRYLNLRTSGTDTITLDFNFAFNPDCAYSPIMICVIPPSENRLPLRIEAGEKLTETKSSKKSEKVSDEAPKKSKKEEKSKETKSVSGDKTETVKTSNSGVKDTGKYADFEGNKIYYQDFGKGKEALVFVHGWTCTSDFWKEQTSVYGDKRVIVLDLIGHGKSDKPQANYSMEYFAKSVQAVMKASGVKKAVLIGHSMGTPVIRQFYRLYPEQVLGLVIVDGGLRPFAPKAQMDQFLAPLRANYKAVAPTFVDGMSGNLSSEIKTYIKTEMMKTPEHVALSALDGMGDETIYAKDSINVPVMAILAESSFGQQADIKPFLQSFIPNLDFRMWQGVSHFLMMEKPQEFTQAIKFYLNKNKFLQ